MTRFEEALPITENSVYYSENLIFISQTLFQLGDIDKAIEYLEKAHLVAIENDQQFEIVKILIDESPELEEKYGEQVPVILINDQPHDFFRVDPERFRSAISKL